MTTSSPLRFAATCMALRQRRGQLIEVLMVRRKPELSFGGMWTFPGGVIEPEDGELPDARDEDTVSWHDPALVSTAANAAVRETHEETSVSCAVGSLNWFSHWIPPKLGPPKRFATWFFLAPEHDGNVVVDQTENDEARWVTASAALEESAVGRFPLAIPTWVTLDDLRHAEDVGSLVDRCLTMGPLWYHTRKLRPSGQSRLPALCWPGDSGYESGDRDAAGERDRVITNDKFEVVERVRSAGWDR